MVSLHWKGQTLIDRPLGFPKFSWVSVLFLAGCTGFSWSGFRGCTGDSKIGSTKTGDDPKDSNVVFLGEFEIPLKEISGLGIKRNAAGADEVIAIGDHDFDLFTGPGIPGPSWVKNLHKISLEKNLASGAEKTQDQSSSQFEAVVGDGGGLMAVLSEESSEVTFFNDGGKRVSVLALTVPLDSPLRTEWDADSGSRGEGMVMLRNGHMLLLKEKKPALIIEFGPPGSTATGYRPGDAVANQDTFIVPKNGSTFVPLKWWRPGSTAKKEAHDLSELAVSARGRLLALSDKDRAVFEVEKRLDPEEENFHFKCRWLLPDQIAKPEGLVMLRDGTVLVGIDTKEAGPNLFWLRLDPCP